MKLTIMFPCTLAERHALCAWFGKAGASATIPPPLHRTFEETCQINGKMAPHKYLQTKVKHLTFNNVNHYLDSEILYTV
jgi:hypothetical protein